MRKKIKIFVSYASKNRDLALRFIDNFHEQVNPSKKYKYDLWSDKEILVGENWHDEIQNAIKICNLGLLLISPAFLGSQYITKYELKKFMKSETKLLIPVMLQPVDFDRHDLKGLRRNQIFRLNRPRFNSPKAYGDCTGNQREQFAQKLFVQIESKLDKIMKK